MRETADTTKTVAITGATGLLGLHLCDYFHSKGWRVNALVRDDSQYPFSEKGIDVYKCNLPDFIDFKAIETVDIVIHSAYMTRYTNLNEARRVNEDGTVKLYEASRNLGVGKFVFVSSRAARPNAQSYYARSKYKLESMMDLSNDLIIRPGLIVADDGGLFHRIMQQVKSLPIIPAFGGGEQKLYTVHIDDLCMVFEWAIENRLSGIISVAESEGITMKELYRAILKQLGQQKPILSVPGIPFILLLQVLEFFKLKLPVSSESLRGLLNRDNIDLPANDAMKQSGIRIRPAYESIKSLTC